MLIDLIKNQPVINESCSRQIGHFNSKEGIDESIIYNKKKDRDLNYNSRINNDRKEEEK